MLATPLVRGSDLDRVLVIVNEEVITQSDLDQRFVQQVSDLRAMGESVPEEFALRRQLLHELVLDQVLLQHARDRKIIVAESDVGNALARMAKRNRLSLSAFRKEVERRGVSFRHYREDLRNQLTIRQLIQSEVTRRIEVSDEEIDQFLATESGFENLSEPALDLSHILISVPEQASAAERGARESVAYEVLDEVRSRPNFGEVAKQFSDGPNAAAGGHLGLRPLSKLPNLLVNAAAELAPGEISSIVESASGFHIVRLNARAERGEQLVQQYRVRHILQVPNAVVGVSQVRARLDHIRDRILAGGDFSELARLHSEDLATRASGGDLGWIGEGDAAPEFENAFKELSQGQVSVPTETRYGVHLIEVTDERLHEVGVQRLRARARDKIRKRKTEESYQAWLDKIAGEAYIQYRDSQLRPD